MRCRNVITTINFALPRAVASYRLTTLNVESRKQSDTTLITTFKRAIQHFESETLRRAHPRAYACGLSLTKDSKSLTEFG